MPNSILERSAAADLSRNTLSRIPTVFGRLEYLASLRDPHSGIYEHDGLVSAYGAKESRRALAQSHREVFQEWLGLPLTDKVEDLKNHLRGLADPAAVLEYWTKGPLFRSYLPDGSEEGAKTLFFGEIRILLEVLHLRYSRDRRPVVPPPASVPANSQEVLPGGLVGSATAREEILKKLMTRTSGRQERLQQAAMRFKEVAADVPSAIPNPDGTTRIQGAAQNYRRAVRDFSLAQSQMVAFLLHDIIPDDLERDD
jgi:hypothetical protein